MLFPRQLIYSQPKYNARNKLNGSILENHLKKQGKCAETCGKNLHQNRSQQFYFLRFHYIIFAYISDNSKEIKLS